MWLKIYHITHMMQPSHITCHKKYVTYSQKDRTCNPKSNICDQNDIT